MKSVAWVVSGYCIVFGIYFAVKTVQFNQLKIVKGVVTRIGKFESRIDVPASGLGGDDKIDQANYYPEITFRDQTGTNDTGKIYVTQNNEERSFHNYRAGDSALVCYDPASPEKARAYSFAEYWLPVPTMVLLGFGCLVWTIAYIFVVKKPYKNGY